MNLIRLKRGTFCFCVSVDELKRNNEKKYSIPYTKQKCISTTSIFCFGFIVAKLNEKKREENEQHIYSRVLWSMLLLASHIFFYAVNFMAIIYSWICFIYRIRPDWIIFAFIIMCFAALSWVLIGDFRQRLSWVLTSFSLFLSVYVCKCSSMCVHDWVSLSVRVCVCVCVCRRRILSLSRISIPVKWLCIIYNIKCTSWQR